MVKLIRYFIFKLIYGKIKKIIHPENSKKIKLKIEKLNILEIIDKRYFITLFINTHL